MLRQISQKQADEGDALTDHAPLHHLLAGLVIFFATLGHGKQPAEERDNHASHSEEGDNDKYLVHELIIAISALNKRNILDKFETT